MRTFKNLLIRSKLFLSVGFIWLLLLSVVLVAYFGMQKITRSESELASVHFQVANDLVQLRSYQNHNRADILEMLLSKDPVQQAGLKKELEDRAVLIEEMIAELNRKDSAEAFRKDIEILQTNLVSYRKNREKQIDLLGEGKVQEAQELGTGIQAELFEQIRSQIYKLADRASLHVSQQLEQDQKNAKTSMWLFIGLGVLALLFSIFIVFALNQTIAKPLNDLSYTAAEIAEGNLQVQLKNELRKDEVGILNNAFFNMVNKLKKSISEILEGVNTLGSSASEILAATTQVAAGASETATSISETTTTVEEVRQAASLSSEKASRVSENSNQVAMVTQSGQKAVEEVVSGMQNIKSQMDSIANTIVRLSEQSQQIGGIIAAVNDVADQSNLLAVNAAIEAAKAGEQGKGFSIVAQEIKNLAQQSKQATAQVRAILFDVQKATTAAVMATEQGTKAVEYGVKQSAKAGESIDLLAKNVRESVQAATQIVASSQQQTIGMDQVGLAMTNINQAGTENAASMIQAEKAAKELHELGQRLKMLVEQYKI